MQVKPEVRLPLRERVVVGGPEERRRFRTQCIIVVVKSVVVGAEDQGKRSSHL